MDIECNINVMLSSHHASIYIIISKIDYSHIHHLFNIKTSRYTLPCRLMNFTSKTINNVIHLMSTSRSTANWKVIDLIINHNSVGIDSCTIS